MSIIKINDIDLTGKRVFVRADLNVPMKDGKIVSATRIHASLPSIQFLLKQKAKIMLASHLGRPIEGKYDDKFSLFPVIRYLKDRLPIQVRLVKDYLNQVEINKDELIVLENVRFNKGEKKNDELLSKKYADLCDVFVMDAFGTAHRSHASTHGITKFVDIACAGPLLVTELNILNKILKSPSRPMVAIVGGSKISTKLTVLDSLSKVVDYLIVGGGIANTFLAAQGYNIGKSLHEIDLLDEANRLLRICDIITPIDVYVTTSFSNHITAKLKSINNIKDNEQIMDLGDSSIIRIANLLKSAKTILWNGPLGVIELPSFCKGTQSVASAIANSQAFSIIGGGDTLMVIELLGLADKISYISTGGGAFLNFISGKVLPAVAMLEAHTKTKSF